MINLKKLFSKKERMFEEEEIEENKKEKEQ